MEVPVARVSVAGNRASPFPGHFDESADHLGDLGRGNDDVLQALVGRRKLERLGDIPADFPDPLGGSMKPGRSESCFCGSGLKSKKCHGK
jgi:hypothetical protein